MGFNRFFQGFTGFYWVLLGFTSFYWISTGFHLVLLDLTGFYLVLQHFTEFYLVLPGFGFFFWFSLAGSSCHYVRRCFVFQNGFSLWFFFCFFSLKWDDRRSDF